MNEEIQIAIEEAVEEVLDDIYTLAQYYESATVDHVYTRNVADDLRALITRVREKFE